MNNLIFTTLLGFTSLLFAFIPADFAKKVKLTVELKDCAATDSLYLFQFEGFGFSKVMTAAGKEGKYEFKFPLSTAQFYYLGKDVKQLKPILLGTETEVKVKGNCADLTTALVGSQLNQDYEKLKKSLETLKAETESIYQDFRNAQTDEGAQKMAIFEMGEVDEKRMDLLNEYKEKSPLLAEVVAINTYLSFHNNAGNYYSEVDYFANEFFKFADFTNSYYSHNPWVYETFKEYAATLSSVGIEADLHQSYLDDALHNLPADEHVYQLALAGIVNGLDERKHKHYTLYGRQLLKKYEQTHKELIAGLKQRIEGAGAFDPGAVAPDFTQNTPTGEPLSLSDLRGKIVLVDFWASWCGPCRRENPHVKELYEKYSHRGFEIIGVSLDRAESSWKQAIEQDGLKWYHVSDLKGWKNEVAQLYSVSSIPHTILLDQEGRIIARKLRAVQLEEMLAQIFGS